MPTVEELASAAIELINARAASAQAAQRESERLANEQAQRESEQAARVQRATIRAEFSRLCELEKMLKAEIETKRSTHAALSRELPVLGDRFSALLSELGRMRQRYDFLRG